MKIPSIKQVISLIFHQSLLENAVFLIIGSLVTALFNFVFLIIATRLYSTEAVGLSSVAISSFGLIGLVSELGLGIAVIRFIPSSEKESNNLLNFFLTFNTLASIVTTAIFLIGLNLWSKSLLPIRQDPLLLSVFACTSLASAMQPIILNVFLARRSTKWIAVINTVIAVLKVILVAVISFLSNSIFGILIGVGLATISGLLITIFFFLPKVQPSFFPKPRIRIKGFREIVEYSLGNYVARVLIQLSPMIIPFFIIYFLGAESNAVYYIAVSVSSLITIIPSSIFNSLFAEASNDAVTLRKNTIGSLKFMSILLIPTIVIAIILSKYLLLIFGGTYSDQGTLLLRISVVNTFPWGINYLYISIARFEKRMGDAIKITVLSTVIGITLSYILISKIGLVGAGIGSLIGQTFSALIVVYLLRKILFIQPLNN
jgi:O-antigen/teichoic acid export membrane protein